MKLIVFAFKDYETEGGWYDILEDEDGVKIFESEKEVIKYMESQPEIERQDNLQIIDIDKLKTISEYNYIWDGRDHEEGHYKRMINAT